VRVEEDGQVTDLPAQEAEAGGRRVERPPVALNPDLVVVDAVEVARELELPLRVGEDRLDAPVVARELQAQFARGAVAVRHEDLERGRALRAGAAPRAEHEEDCRCQLHSHALQTRRPF
jgi:hypothetical protein